jgi:hypothetical protein
MVREGSARRKVVTLDSKVVYKLMARLPSVYMAVVRVHGARLVAPMACSAVVVTFGREFIHATADMMRRRYYYACERSSTGACVYARATELAGGDGKTRTLCCTLMYTSAAPPRLASRQYRSLVVKENGTSWAARGRYRGAMCVDGSCSCGPREGTVVGVFEIGLDLAMAGDSSHPSSNDEKGAVLY